MFRLLHRQGDPVRSELGELKKLLRSLASSEPRTRFGVGAGVCLANAEFLRRFGGMQWFCRGSPEERAQFYSVLSDLETSLRGRGAGEALGVGLYHIWLADAFAGRRQAAELLGEHLTKLSRRASCALPADEA